MAHIVGEEESRGDQRPVVKHSREEAALAILPTLNMSSILFWDTMG